MTASSFLWTPALTTQPLDERMDNAMRRVSGSIGMDISMDKSRIRTLKDTAAQALETGMTSLGPWFMRAGQAAFEAGFCKIGSSIDIKEVGSEILYEFFTEANAVFQVQKAMLCAEASSHLEHSGVAPDVVQKTVNSADAALVTPSKDAFTKAGLPYVSESVQPATAAAFAALAGGAGLFVLTRAPHLGVLGAAALGAAGYFVARSRRRAKAETLLRQLPRVLYDLLAVEWNGNTRRYAETVNAAITAYAGKG